MQITIYQADTYLTFYNMNTYCYLIKYNMHFEYPQHLTNCTFYNNFIEGFSRVHLHLVFVFRTRGLLYKILYPMKQ